MQQRKETLTSINLIHTVKGNIIFSYYLILKLSFLKRKKNQKEITMTPFNELGHL